MDYKKFSFLKDALIWSLFIGVIFFMYSATKKGYGTGIHAAPDDIIIQNRTDGIKSNR